MELGRGKPSRISPHPFQLLSPGAGTSERCSTTIEIWISAGTHGERDKGASSVLEMIVGMKKQVYLSGQNQISTGKPATSISCQEGYCLCAAENSPCFGNHSLACLLMATVC